MTSSKFLRAFAATAWLITAVVNAEDLPANVLVKSRWMELTRADYEKAVSRLPENLRFEFSTNRKRVEGLLNNLLVTKTLAAQARAHGTRAGASFANGTEDSDPALAAAELSRVEADAAKSFEAQKDAFEMKARELYALNREKYREAEAVRLSDIAVAIKDRGEEAALARAREARQRVVAGADFATVAREFSDDPTSRAKGGALPFVTASGLTADYAKAVFAIKTVGEISEPIKAPSAYHVVRLEERRGPRLQTFEEVRASIMRDLEKRYVAEQREKRIASIHGDPELRINQAAIDALLNRIDPALLEKAKPAPRSRDSAPK